MTELPKKVCLIGAGIMSATLAVMLKKLIPNVRIDIYERLDKIGAESSDAWNNAGTGHSAFCELNYTPLQADGTVDISKALRISQSFEQSKQFWAYLKQQDTFPNKTPFINDIDHMSFVWGDENISFLKKRYQALTKYTMFEDMLFSEDYDEISEWIPLMMKERNRNEKVSITMMAIGTDVNFGAITREMIANLETLDDVTVHLGQEIQDITKQHNDTWKIEIEDKKEYVVTTDFLFIGAGGGAMTLLEKTDIPEGRGYGGFPISGQWLKCTNKDVIAQHEAKVYGKAATGSPPMSVPHLDTRMIQGEKALLFGPYAGFSTKFLKNGSYLDLPLSLEVHNIWPMLSVGIHNYKLTKYLVEQVMQSPEDRFEALQAYYPDAKFEDWELAIAGQRVQIIKKDEEEGGVLQFGTKITVGAWRASEEPMQVISGSYGKEIIHFEAPPSKDVAKEMKDFIKWFNNTAPNGINEIKHAPIRCAIAHLYFETIHPFEDGNGRIGRVIAEKALLQTIKHPLLLSLSVAIESNRKKYYEALKKGQRNNEITSWLRYFMETLLKALENSEELINFTLQKAKLFDDFKTQFNERQSKVLKKMLEEGTKGFEGGMNAKNYMRITKTSKSTATRDLQKLNEMGAFKSFGKGKNTMYKIQFID